jgi:hypothetical protein
LAGEPALTDEYHPPVECQLASGYVAELTAGPLASADGTEGGMPVEFGLWRIDGDVRKVPFAKLALFCRESRGCHPGVGRDPAGRRADHQPGHDIGRDGVPVRQAALAGAWLPRMATSIVVLRRRPRVRWLPNHYPLTAPALATSR